MDNIIIVGINRDTRERLRHTVRYTHPSAYAILRDHGPNVIGLIYDTGSWRYFPKSGENATLPSFIAKLRRDYSGHDRLTVNQFIATYCEEI